MAFWAAVEDSEAGPSHLAARLPQIRWGQSKRTGITMSHIYQRTRPPPSRDPSILGLGPKADLNLLALRNFEDARSVSG